MIKNNLKMNPVKEIMKFKPCFLRFGRVFFVQIGTHGDLFKLCRMDSV